VLTLLYCTQSMEHQAVPSARGAVVVYARLLCRLLPSCSVAFHQVAAQRVYRLEWQSGRDGFLRCTWPFCCVYNAAILHGVSAFLAGVCRRRCACDVALSPSTKCQYSTSTTSSGRAAATASSGAWLVMLRFLATRKVRGGTGVAATDSYGGFIIAASYLV
jgi:hypothetical protein